LCPQKWTSDVNYIGKRVAVIGSGATAITLVPALAKHAAHVTMVQRSPTYILSVPNRSELAAKGLKSGKPVPEILKSVRARQSESWNDLARHFAKIGQEKSNALVCTWMRQCLPKEYMSDEDFARHFTPRYNLLEQRLCVCPDNDFFDSFKHGRASIVTDQIRCFDKDGIVLQSGERVDCDVIVTATGLELHPEPPMGTMQVTIDGKPYVGRDHSVYKDCMLSDVPNFIFSRGYLLQSWTLKIRLVSAYMCRLLKYMRQHGVVSVCPRVPPQGIGRTAPMTFKSGYLQRNRDRFPASSLKAPWHAFNNYDQDKVYMEQSRLADGILEFELPHLSHQQFSSAGPVSRL